MTELEIRIVKFVKENSPVTTSEVAYAFGRNCTYTHHILKKLIREGRISPSDIKSRAIAVKTTYVLTKTGKWVARFITVRNAIGTAVLGVMVILAKLIVEKYLEVTVINRFINIP